MGKATQNVSIAIVYRAGPDQGAIEIVHGQLARMRVTRGRGSTTGEAFAIAGGSPARLEIAVSGVMVAPGAHASVVRVKSRRNSFAFFLRDVFAETPIFLPQFSLAVTTAGDRRTYDEIAEAVRAKNLSSELQRIEQEPEETYQNACAANRQQVCPTWLGLGRDMRFFEVGYSPEYGFWGYVQPRYHSVLQNLPETDNKPCRVGFLVGPGSACRTDITRRLEDGALPILRSVQREGDVVYHLTAFATLETRPVAPGNVRGSDWRAAYPNTGGHMCSADELARMKHLCQAEMRGRNEETVCCLRLEAVNESSVPRYAWFSAARFEGPLTRPASYDGQAGLGALASGRVFAINRLDGTAMPQEEVAVLVAPGAKAVLEILIPHQPISLVRARRMARLDFNEHLDACRRFWRTRLASAARIRVPEPEIDERIRAGLLHCDLAALGKEPNGHVLATIGWYSPIGSESSPIIQFFDSMGWHKLAERSLNFFLARQREDGFIQNFAGYQLETGPALWSMGEHYRYTRDNAWVRRIKPKLLTACEFLLNWRRRNMRPELRGRGWGLLDGKVADPEDFFHSFMLNGLSYLGIARVSEMLASVDPAESLRLAKEAAAFKKDIRRAFTESVARSPVIPAGDGTWLPSAPPWAEYPGPVSLYAEGGQWHTHGAFGARDSLVGSLYLGISEILDANEPAATFMLNSHQVLFTRRNAGLSQPYYCRHDWLHVQRGEVKAFLKTYYNQFTALQDRQTYTFWEHYFHVSQHKTHEEGWFLMQTRWMLYLEKGDALCLLSAAPRRWLENGKRIELHKVASYFGPVSMEVKSDLAEGCIRATVECPGARRPRAVILRLPHPDGLKARSAEGGKYDRDGEAVTIEPFSGKTRVVVRF